jgi:hypothetical protein
VLDIACVASAVAPQRLYFIHTEAVPAGTILHPDACLLVSFVPLVNVALEVKKNPHAQDL